MCGGGVSLCPELDAKFTRIMEKRKAEEDLGIETYDLNYSDSVIPICNSCHGRALPKEKDPLYVAN